MAEPSSYTYKITAQQAAQLREILARQQFQFREVPYTIFGAKLGKLNVNAYTSGKLLVQGKGAREFIEFTLEPEILGEAKLGYEEIHNPEMFQPHMGVDESGKGDFFGPLVIAGAYTDAKLTRQLMEMGVVDSKRITSDKKAEDLSEAIEDLLQPWRFHVICIGPVKYNELYGKFRNLNRLLAWGHATIIENVLTKVPACPRALSDQFGNPRLIQSALKERGKGITLQQRTKAESDVAVAAASILARAKFVSTLRKLGEDLGVPLPKGASAQVKAAALRILTTQGEEALAGVAKKHFKTYGEVLAKS